MDFIAIDFEIANNNLSSACSLGMVFVNNNQIVDEKYFLIQPPSLIFDEKMTKVHGLTRTDVQGADKFDKVWDEIKSYFNSETLVIAHNAQFDMSVLKSCLVEYSLEIPEFRFADSIQISAKACGGNGVRGSLKARTEWFGIVLNDHHNALADARACAELVIKSVQLKNRKSIHTFLQTYRTSILVKSFSELKHQTSFYRKQTQKFKKIDVNEIAPACEELACNHPLYDKQIVFTGELSMMERETAMQKAVNVGGIIKSGVSRNTQYLVVGKQDKSLVGAKGISTKEVKAYALIEKGFEIKIINEAEFVQLLEPTNL
ncbi:exonuclease [Bacillus sp. DNRA2]|uniref:exonuclease domain-containing protein n=1 Tax=Bacillus sp. DNRA2 TaxID=2723053 RepID=UPI00145D31FB|nr:exonuclease domain-containing protein [Bacillus sp. DNRA2]NMD71635.1 exonuclease [Bacillus sp. DNRA2]